ncbi:MAG: thiamine pyrophosphate-binding protein [Rhodospirillales bacterium]|nr:thiamine pyrophosphate-binding protein [Rhodospirillales bacterium]
MKKTGAQLAVFALEQLGIRHTFGIPGVHNTEVYDELNKSKLITPILVTHEGGASFMADAVSRVSDYLGTLVIVPAAGATHAASGIGEAFLDGIPMLVICGGVRSDSQFKYQLHEMDQHALLSGITKKSFFIETHEQVIPTLYEAHKVAQEGVPGPVFVELPVNLQLMTGPVSGMPTYSAETQASDVAADKIAEAAKLIRTAKRPGLFVGWGAMDAAKEVMALAELMDAPVSTTLQGLSVFPGNHALHAGFGFGASAVPSAQNAFADCDCMVAIGTKFSEIGTGSFGVLPPANLIHIDIDPEAIDANFPAAQGIVGDAGVVLKALLAELGNDAGQDQRSASATAVKDKIKTDKVAYREEWRQHDSGERVNPEGFFSHLRQSCDDEAIIVADDGNHTFLTAELMPIHKPKAFICPTDFNAMGYAVPAAIGAKMAQPEKVVAAIVGDGCFTMTCMEILTATRNNLGVIFYVFRDGELSQIAQAQEIPYNRKPCTNLDVLNCEGVAMATGAGYLKLEGKDDVSTIMKEALRIAGEGRPVVVEVAIDYSKRTAYTIGAVKTNLSRFDIKTKLRFIGRAVVRKVTG